MELSRYLSLCYGVVFLECLYAKRFQKAIPYTLICGPRQFYKDCETCEKTCSNPTPVCSNKCSRGCFCKEGYVKAPDGSCVVLKDCPKAEVSLAAHDLSVEDCGSDEEYLTCGWCEPTCSEPHPRCPQGVCTRGCLCRPPLLRHHKGQCVEAKLCLPQKCPTLQEEYVCRYGCEVRCDRKPCTRPRYCVLGCHCKLGYRRNKLGHCVRPEQCDQNIPQNSITVNSATAVLLDEFEGN